MKICLGQLYLLAYVNCSVPDLVVRFCGKYTLAFQLQNLPLCHNAMFCIVVLLGKRRFKCKYGLLIWARFVICLWHSVNYTTFEGFKQHSTKNGSLVAYQLQHTTKCC